MNFAPYQSSPPESTRALSPPPRSQTASPSTNAQRVRVSQDKTRRQQPIASVADQSDPWAAARGGQRLPSPSQFADDAEDGGYQDLEGQRGRGAGTGQQQGGDSNYFLGGAGGGASDVFETSLGLRMDWEACLAYLLLPPAGGVVLLIFEHKSDYVRFHAWQSALVFSAAFILHLILAWSKVLSWILFTLDLLLIAYCTFRAYKDAETLDRLELPIAGRLASRFVDSE